MTDHDDPHGVCSQGARNCWDCGVTCSDEDPCPCCARRVAAVCACCGLRRTLVHHDWSGSFCPDCIGHKATYPPVSGGAGAASPAPSSG